MRVLKAKKQPYCFFVQISTRNTVVSIAAPVASTSSPSMQMELCSRDTQDGFHQPCSLLYHGHQFLLLFLFNGGCSSAVGRTFSLDRGPNCFALGWWRLLAQHHRCHHTFPSSTPPASSSLPSPAGMHSSSHPFRTAIQSQQDCVLASSGSWPFRQAGLAGIPAVLPLSSWLVEQGSTHSCCNWAVTLKGRDKQRTPADDSRSWAGGRDVWHLWCHNENLR